jgi:Domain of unknown function (DUF4189)
LLRLVAAFVLLSGSGLAAEPRQSTPAGGARSIGPWATPPAEFGALAFTPDGTFSSVWKYASKAEAETKVRADCAKLRRGRCEVVSFQADVCAAIASFHHPKAGALTYAGGGMGRAEAEQKALKRCNRDRRSKRACKVRTVVCGDGR